MRYRIALLLLLFLPFLSEPVMAQRRKRPPKQENQQTPETAKDKAGADRAKKEADYKYKSEHHDKIQDKATRKRMKKNLKKAEKQSWGKHIPWYKRVFRKRKF